jgi:hypothetical protein
MGVDRDDATRPEVRDLTEVERTILEFAVSTMTVGAAEARAPIVGRASRRAGASRNPRLLQPCTRDDVPLIPDGERWPLLFDVDSPPDDPLTIELFASDGLLKGVDLTTYGDDAVGSTWPDVGTIHRAAYPF